MVYRLLKTLRKATAYLLKILPLLAVAALLFAPKMSHAAIYGSQTDNSGSLTIGHATTLTVALGSPALLNQTAGSSTLTLYVKYPSICDLHLGDYERPIISEYSDAGYSSLIQSAGVISAAPAVGSSGTGNTTGTIVFSLDTANFWHTGDYYKLDFSSNDCGDNSHYLTLGANGANTIPYFLMSDVPGSPISFQFDTPAPSSTLPDFNPWVLSGYNFNPSSTYTMGIAYADPITPSLIYSDSGSFTVPGGSGTFTIPKLNRLSNGYTFTAYATLFEGTSSAIIASASSTFSIASSTPIVAPDCNFTSSSFFGDPVGNIKQGVCGAFIWAFIPGAADQSDLNAHLAALNEAVKNKPPFGYFSAITSAFNAFQIATSTTSTALLNASGTTVFASTFSTLDLGLAAILWFLFAWYIFHRIKKIQL